jgi:hypothetical protein
MISLSIINPLIPERSCTKLKRARLYLSLNKRKPLKNLMVQLGVQSFSFRYLAKAKAWNEAEP